MPFKPDNAFNKPISKIPGPNLGCGSSASYKMTMFMSPVAAKVLERFQQYFRVTD
jgi:hypothetical protein